MRTVRSFMKSLLGQTLANRILVIDGAMGTCIQGKNLLPEDFGGDTLDGCNENLVVTRPDIIEAIHDNYLEAGADIIETNTFGANRFVLAEYNIADKVDTINRAAVRLARKSVQKYTTPDHPRFVAGALGPTNKSLSVTGGATFSDMRNAYHEQAFALIQAGVDLLFLETSQDTRNVKAALIGITTAQEKLKTDIPLFVSASIEMNGTMLGGQDIQAFYTSIKHAPVVAVGLNCATGPKDMITHIRTLSQICDRYVFCYPNAGLPNEDGTYDEDPDTFSETIAQFMRAGFLNLVGGCCGTTPAHITALRTHVARYSPRHIPDIKGCAPQFSGIDHLNYDAAMRPLFVGERANVQGSRKFKRLITENLIDEATEIARAQVAKGAHIIDICLEATEYDEIEMIHKFYPKVSQAVKVPIMIDSTSTQAIETALTYLQGTAIVNSINMESGRKRFDEVIPLVKQYGGKVVVGLIDESGMAVHFDHKIKIADRFYPLLTENYGLAPDDIIWDALVFTVDMGGNPDYIGSSRATIDAIRALKNRYPQTLTILGISNVSFGLPPAGREVLNAVFLHRCVEAGLDLAIVNTQLLKPYTSISRQEIDLCDQILFDGKLDTIQRFTEFYRDKKRSAMTAHDFSGLSPEEIISKSVVMGTKAALPENLSLLLKRYQPLEIINGPLMSGMDEVGRLFGNGDMIVSEVLQSAEVMKAAVGFLEPHMETTTDTHSRGKMVIATVKGDVHDIGKNLVDIILSNNGFKVYDLGIKVDSPELITAVRKYNPDIVGLSGLLVKSTQQMAVTASDFKRENITTPIVVGGAALSKRFTANRIAPEYDGPVYYAKDAMKGLDIIREVVQGEFVNRLHPDTDRLEKRKNEPPSSAPATGPTVTSRSDAVPRLNHLPLPPDTTEHYCDNYSYTTVWQYLNPRALYNNHMGYRGNFTRALADGDDRAITLKHQIDRVKEWVQEKRAMSLRAIWRFYRCRSEGNDVIIYDSTGRRAIERFTFPRQHTRDRLCIADYFDPEQLDTIGFFVVTAGDGIRDAAQRFKDTGEYIMSHGLHALAIETAEALAEYLHKTLRTALGRPDNKDLTMTDIHAARYSGKRYSFGYPACPDLASQAKLFNLLDVDRIGVQLTDGYMMDPEASVSAIVIHHPQARYFSVQTEKK